ncbi:MAG: YihA family ribosome biogenesis GTP-binding protein [Ruminococcaceae bacterium]|nr:YihA family ribosome biogenesis GTP-binding protein [Oscillospiraceae bacterium]
MKWNLNNAALQMSAGLPKQFPGDRLPQVAFSGRSNVGKSSLINSLLNRKNLARVSGEPGKTITVNFYNIDKKLYLVDLPGYGYAKRTKEDQKKWSSLTDGYFTNNPNFDSVRLVCQLIDSRIGPTDDDWDMLEYLTEARCNFIVVGTKCDKLNRTERNAFVDFMKENMPEVPYILYSAKDGEGREDLWKAITEAVLN